MPNRSLWIELISLFFVIPILLALPINLKITIPLTIVGFVYVIVVMAKMEQLKLKKLVFWPKDFQWRNLILRFVLFAIISTIGVFLWDAEYLFKVVRMDYVFWLKFCGIYTLFSVIPQELIYRYFFKSRYSNLLSNEQFYLLVNAITFSLAHLFLFNLYICILMFIGGYIFSWTFKRSNSLAVVSIEHMLYGLWLFTLGLGEFIAFPLPN